MKHSLLESSCLSGRALVPLTHSEHELFHPKQLGLKLLQLLGPHNGERWFKASSLLFLQWPGWLCPRPRRQPVSGCSRWGVWMEKTVKVLKQLLLELQMQIWSNTCLGSEPANSKGETYDSPPEFTSPESRLFSLIF